MADIERVIDEARGAVLPFESWERLSGEGASAYSAFCAYRDFGPERNIRRAAGASCAAVGEAGEGARGGGAAGRPEGASCAAKKYRVWRLWSMRFRWRERAGDYDDYLDKMRRAERRKALEGREAAYREATGKMLSVVGKRLDMMRPDELPPALVAGWLTTAIGAEREVERSSIDGLVPGGREGKKAGGGFEVRFAPEFEGM